MPSGDRAASETLAAQRFVLGHEGSVLSKLPGYEYLKQAGTSALGLGETAEHPVVLAHLGGAWRLGVQTDQIVGDLVAVFCQIHRTRWADDRPDPIEIGKKYTITIPQWLAENKGMVQRGRLDCGCIGRPDTR